MDPISRSTKVQNLREHPMHQLLVIFLTLTLYSCGIFKNSILVDADPQFQRWQKLKNGQQWEKDQPVQEEQEPPLLTEAELKQLQAAMEEMNLQNRRLQQRIDENILAGNFPKQPMPMIPAVQIPHNSPQMVPVQMAMPPSPIAQQVTQPQVSAIDYMMLNLYLSTKLEKARKQEENCQGMHVSFERFVIFPYSIN
ncbi:hypothetical protein T12_11594 [Trichinella patagoniensis]|uniref:Uncharacterized protein n=1 Tax=Trichinella patagoniensis TaxID=990121 RepID=A0A0V0ZDE1_9BILA|nr:hypothetical protein T09_5884 [Trichinella sp. T9]KRY10380.1 hypothetical protein T12_5636 [Trichinella patagoniensis]KRY10396.1 hypothetical protein T12_11594 [Trichinella patagoniensis]